MIEKLTALLARTLTFGRGMNPVWSARAHMAIGSTECGSYPNTIKKITSSISLIYYYLKV